MEIHTLQLGKHRIATSRGIPVLNVTRKSGDQHFAPTWDMVLAFKNGQLNTHEYTDMYYDLMRSSYNSDPLYWINLLAQNERLAVACTCEAGAFCHRHLLVNIFHKVALRYNIPFVSVGELAPCHA